ncbi:hypothetical protein FACS1894200_07880 [Spirochaetia bacterium]|nr:hypothetical protein FACS1894200_07880 [Spirochaetia bacterium]
MCSKKILLSLMLAGLLSGIPLFSQVYPTGAILDDALYDSVGKEG